MKESLQCLKCESRRLWVIEPFRTPGELEGPILRVVNHQDPVEQGLFVTRRKPHGHFEAYICCNCGFTELSYGDGAPDLRISYVTVTYADPQRGRLCVCDQPVSAPLSISAGVEKFNVWRGRQRRHRRGTARLPLR